jgi:hypothetical protein
MSDEAIELLTSDDDGHAVKGTLYPRDRGVIKFLPSEEDTATRLAYPVQFFLRDDEGEPRKETLTYFLVPDWMMDGAEPAPIALRLAEERMKALGL